MPSRVEPMRLCERARSEHVNMKHMAPAAEAHAAGAVLLEQRSHSTTRIRRHGLCTGILGLLACFLLLVDSIAPCSASPFGPASRSLHFASHLTRASRQAFLEVFQLYPPVLTVAPDGGLELTDGSSNSSVHLVPSQEPTCTETLVVHSFRSYNAPYAVPYNPPSCSFNRVTWNLTVVAAGVQFDRLGSVSFGDIELFRTSTAEPTRNGVEWTYLKDMTNFLPLFKTQQTLIFDLNNIVNQMYTAPYNVTLSASFFTAEDSIVPADEIIPVSKRLGASGQPSYFTVPQETASNDITMPRNVKKAVFTVAATGQAAEEFWWSNVLQSEVDTFPSQGELDGFSPFREVQLFIDGTLAGVAWPFPVIFTGGIVPGLWRPIVGIDAFDLKEDEIDITPWLPLLCDGKSHEFTIRVSGLNDTGNGTATLSETTDDDWWVDGKIFIWLDETGHITTGNGPNVMTPQPTLQVSSQVFTTANGTNETLLYQVHARRDVSYQSTIQLAQGEQTVSWSQSLTYSNVANYTDQGNLQTTTQHTNGYDVSSSGFARTYSYPLYVYSTSAEEGDNTTYTAMVNRGKDVITLGQPVFPTGLESFSNVEDPSSQSRSFQGASLSTTQNGSAVYFANANASYSFGSTQQEMSFAGIRVQSNASPYFSPKITQSEELFHRYASAVNGTVVEDEETLVDSAVPHYHGAPGGSQVLLADAPLSGVPGRGHDDDPPRGADGKFA